MKRWAILLFCVSLSGCNTYSLIETTRTNIGDTLSVEPQRQWSRVNARGLEVWTVDGRFLESLQFFDGIEAGEEMFQTNGTVELPKFRANMSPTEIQEYIGDTIKKLGAAQLEHTNLRPFQFGNAQGFRFESAFVNNDGLEMNATVAGAIVEEKLFLIRYIGARSYYFGRYLNNVDALMKSVQLRPT